MKDWAQSTNWPLLLPDFYRPLRQQAAYRLGHLLLQVGDHMAGHIEGDEERGMTQAIRRLERLAARGWWRVTLIEDRRWAPSRVPPAVQRAVPRVPMGTSAA
jgi:hypothetical protein